MSENAESTGNEVVDAQFGAEETTTTDAIREHLQTEEINQVKEADNDGESHWDKKFAALTRKDREIRERESAYEQKVAELEALKAQLESKQEPVKEELPLEYRLQRNPIETLAELGLDFEKLTELQLNDGKLSQDMLLRNMQEDLDKKYDNKYGNKLKELEEKLLEKEKLEEEARLNQVVDGFKKEINQHINTDPEKYELIAANEAEDLVYQVIEDNYNKTGKILSVGEASDAVEEYLYEEATKFMKLKKLQAKPEEKTIEPKDLFRESPTTLSNAQSAQAPKLSDRKLTIEESKAQAAKLLNWDL